MPTTVSLGYKVSDWGDRFSWHGDSEQYPLDWVFKSKENAFIRAMELLEHLAKRQMSPIRNVPRTYTGDWNFRPLFIKYTQEDSHVEAVITWEYQIIRKKMVRNTVTVDGKTFYRDEEEITVVRDWTPLEEENTDYWAESRKKPFEDYPIQLGIEEVKVTYAD